jgi:dephospho-CoA kinase
MSEDDARARMASQASDEQRRALADHIVDNGGDLDALRRAVAALWKALNRSE